MSIYDGYITALKSDLNAKLKQTGNDLISGETTIKQEVAKYKGLIPDDLLQSITDSAIAQNAAAVNSAEQDKKAQEEAQAGMSTTVKWVGGISLAIVAFLIYKNIKS